jgi:hypothetical protein
LRSDPALRARVGDAARRTVEELYGGNAWRRKLAFFLPRERASARAPSLCPTLDPTPSELR